MDTELKEQDPTPNILSSHEGNWYILICGLPIRQDVISLGGGLTLRQLSNPLTVFDLAAAGARGFREWAVLEPLSSYCYCELESARDAAVVPGYSTSGRAWLASAMMVLKGYVNLMCVAINAYSWNLIAGWQERAKASKAPIGSLPEFKGSLLDYHLRTRPYKGGRGLLLADSDAAWITERFNTVNEMTSRSERMRFALEAAVDWRYQENNRSAIARLWGGIEALIGVDQELRFRLALISAAALAPRGTVRIQKFQDVKKLYEVRSKAVHGDSLNDDALINGIGESFDLLRDLLLLNIERRAVLSTGDYERLLLE